MRWRPKQPLSFPTRYKGAHTTLTPSVGLHRTHCALRCCCDPQHPFCAPRCDTCATLEEQAAGRPLQAWGAAKGRLDYQVSPMKFHSKLNDASKEHRRSHKPTAGELHTVPQNFMLPRDFLYNLIVIDSLPLCSLQNLSFRIVIGSSERCMTKKKR